MDECKEQEETRGDAEGAEADENSRTTDNGDTTSSNTESEQGKPKVQDMSEYIIDTEEDVGKKQYKIMLMCHDERVRLTADEEPEVTVNEKNRLKVKVGPHKIYHRTRLKAEVTKWKVNKSNRGGSITILLDKKKHELWK